MDSQTASPSQPANPTSNVMLAASFGGSDGDSDYVESDKNSPMSLASTSNLKRHISELETMNKVLKGEIDAIVRPTEILS